MSIASTHSYSVVIDTFAALLKDKDFIDSQSVNAITRMKAKQNWVIENSETIVETYDWTGFVGLFNNLFDADGYIYSQLTLYQIMRERSSESIAPEFYTSVSNNVQTALNAGGTTESAFHLTPRSRVVAVEQKEQLPKPYITPEALQNTSYSGADMVATIQLPNGRPQVLGELATINYSVYREKTLVRALGSVRPNGIARGQRTISGILEFVNFDRSVAYKLLSDYYDMGYHILMDELPQFDITISMANETGQRSVFRIYGISTFTEGSMMSIDQITTRSSYEFFALDIDPMAPLSFQHGAEIGGVSG